MYTRGGDKGETSLYGSRRVPKDSVLVDAYGTIDELNSLIGVAISECRYKEISRSLKQVQRMLFVAGADAACEFGGAERVPRISAGDTEELEAMTKALLKKLPTLRNFILPGGGRLGANLMVARAVCRRAERRIVAASRGEGINPELLPFFNRLSTYLFDLSRYANKKAGKKEDIWKGES
jgi:cob(I)alamin adenosyltransferase